MRFLLDTNILIPAEPTSLADSESTTPIITHLIGIIAAAKFTAFIHPASLKEMNGDRDVSRRDLRRQLLKKYEILPSPPAVPVALHHKLGAPNKGTNNAIDNELIAAVERNAVNYLVTSDGGIHKKLARIGLANRGLYPSDAVALTRALKPSESPTLPAVKLGLCHELNREDPFFDSLRSDYPGFDEWLEKCQLAHREVFIIQGGSGISAIAILKDESKESTDRVLKLCCFKVGENSRGFKIGELLLRSVLNYCVREQYDRTYLTCFPKQNQLISMLEEFGYSATTQSESSELILEKSFRPNLRDESTPLGFHIKYGPAVLRTTDEIYVVPLEPRYHRMLFPDLENQRSLFPGETPFGNCIRKAYLCHSPKKHFTPGSILLFYRSHDLRQIQAVGVTESAIRSSDPTEIIEFVGKRTVYSQPAIEEMTANETLAILFRYVTLDVKIQYEDLIDSGSLIGVPQSITQVKEEGLEWIHQQLGM